MARDRLVVSKAGFGPAARSPLELTYDESRTTSRSGRDRHTQELGLLELFGDWLAVGQ
jgi:hypothetical protein